MYTKYVDPISMRAKAVELNTNNQQDDVTDIQFADTLIMKGGGIKGLAYAGAIKVLEKYNYRFNRFVGTSAGAITASLLAVGYSAEELEIELKNKQFSDFLDNRWKWPINLIIEKGLSKGINFNKWLNNLLQRRVQELGGPIGVAIKFCDLSNLPHHPHLIVYTSVAGYNYKEFDSRKPDSQDQEIVSAVRSSMAFPGAFTPEQQFNKYFFDGGIHHNYPVDAFLQNNPETNFIGLFLGPEIFEEQRGIVSQLFSIFTAGAEEEQLRKHNDRTIIIDVSPVTTLDFVIGAVEKEFLLTAGEAAATKFLHRMNSQDGPTKDEVVAISAKNEQLRKQVKTAIWISRGKAIVFFVFPIIIMGILLGIFTRQVFFAKSTSSQTTGLDNRPAIVTPNTLDKQINELEQDYQKRSFPVSKKEFAIEKCVLGYGGLNSRSFMTVEVIGKDTNNKILVNNKDVSQKIVSQLTFGNSVIIKLEGFQQELNLLNGKNEVVIISSDNIVSQPYLFEQAIESRREKIVKNSPSQTMTNSPNSIQAGGDVVINQGMQPRKLQPEQREKLLSVLVNRPKGQVIINTILGDSEAYSFAEELQDILVSAGWKSEGINQSIYNRIPIGLVVQVENRSSPPLHAISLQQSFATIGFEVIGQYQPENPKDSVIFIVGRRP